MERPVFGTLPPRLPRIGGMATMPSRIESLRIALPRILPQVERLYLFLDRHTEVPAEIAADARIVPILPDAATGGLRGAGKFLGLKAFGEPCLYVCFDDDILYPENYVEHMARALHRHRYRAVVGIHGAILGVPTRSYIRDRRTAHFGGAVDVDRYVDELGTGTMAFHSRCIQLDPLRWSRPGKADLMITLEALRQDIPLVLVRRPRGFLQAIAENQEDSLYRAVLADDSVETEILLAAMKLYPGRWALED